MPTVDQSYDPAVPLDALAPSPVNPNDGVLVKCCRRCGRELPIELFAPHRQRRGGRRHLCRPCEELRAATQQALPSSTRRGTTNWTAKRSVTEAERAYLAGIIDGEGCISATFHKSSRSWATFVTVTNTDHRLIVWLDERWHASQCRNRPGTNSRKPTYFWTGANRRCIPILEAALPYLVLKRENAELALEWAAATHNPGRRGYSPEVRERRLAIVARMRELNQRGPTRADG